MSSMSLTKVTAARARVLNQLQGGSACETRAPAKAWGRAGEDEPADGPEDRTCGEAEEKEEVEEEVETGAFARAGGVGVVFMASSAEGACGVCAIADDTR